MDGTESFPIPVQMLHTSRFSWNVKWCFLCSVHLSQSSQSFPAAISVCVVLTRVSVTEHGKLLAEHDALSKVRFYIVFMFAGMFFSNSL